jgi:hypothetical protein
VIGLTYLILPNMIFFRNLSPLLFVYVFAFNIDFINNLLFSSAFISTFSNSVAVILCLALAVYYRLL